MQGLLRNLFAQQIFLCIFLKKFENERMPLNKNALIRYRTIDQCLSNRQRRWTLEDLINACSDALYEYEGIRKGVSTRTVQMDIQNMRSEKLGYNAPIIVEERKYYTYADPDYSISRMPLSGNDLNRLSEVVGILKQFKGFSHFEDLEGMVKKLEDKVEVALRERPPIIDIDRNNQLKGLEFLEPIYQAIQQKLVLKLKYQPFWKPSSQDNILHPYLLKEYNHRWYVVGFNDYFRKINLFGLDRILSIETTSRVAYIENNFFNPEAYFRHVIGVTVSLKSEPVEVILYVLPGSAPYVMTKPLHPSQRLIREIGDGVLISLKVQINFELHAVLRGMCDTVLVVKPSRLRLSIEEDVQNSLALYHDKKLRAKLWKVLNE